MLSEADKRTDKRKGGSEWHGKEDTPVGVRIGSNVCHPSQRYSATEKSNQVRHHRDAHDSFPYGKNHRGSNVLGSLHVVPHCQLPDDRGLRKVRDSISTFESILWTSGHSNNDVMGWC